MTKYYGFYTKNAGKSIKGNRIIYNVDENKNVFVCNGNVLFKMTNYDYNTMIRPVTMCDPGNWIIDEHGKNELVPGQYNLPDLLEKNIAAFKAADNTILQRCPAVWDAGRKTKAVGFYNADNDFCVFANDLFVSFFDPVVKLHGTGAFAPIVAVAGDEIIGIVMPIKTEANKHKAIKAYFEK